MTKCTRVYVALMLGVFPLITLGEYSTILEVKWLFCMTAEVLYVISALIYIAVRIKGKGSTLCLSEVYGDRSGGVFLVCVLIYSVCIVLGNVLCEHKAATLLGVGGKYLGVLTILLSMAAMLAISEYYQRSRIVEIVFAAACALVYLMQILNGLGFDPLGMKEGILEDQGELFAGTLGNLNFNATFNCITAACFMSAAAVYSCSRKTRAILIFLSAEGIAGSVCCRSTGVYLGLGAAALVIIGYMAWRHSKLLMWIYVSIVVIGSVMTFVIWAGHISDHSGHNRVFIWKRTLELFMDYPFVQKMFGCGFNEYRFEIFEFCADEMKQGGYNVFEDAHSEYLQALAATGIIGFLGYFGLIFSTLKKGVEILKENILGLVAVTCIVAFLAQGLVYGPTIVTTPILFVIIGLFWSIDFRKETL